MFQLNQLIAFFYDHLKSILLITSVKTLCLSLLHLCGFNISLFFTNYFSSSLRQSASIIFFSKKFILFSI